MPQLEHSISDVIGVTRRASMSAYRSMRVGEDDEATFAPSPAAIRELEEKRRK